MWGKWKSQTLLLAMQNDTLENNLAFSYKVKHILTTRLNSTPSYLTKINTNICPHKMCMLKSTAALFIVDKTRMMSTKFPLEPPVFLQIEAVTAFVSNDLCAEQT